MKRDFKILLATLLLSLSLLLSINNARCEETPDAELEHFLRATGAIHDAKGIVTAPTAPVVEEEGEEEEETLAQVPDNARSNVQTAADGCPNCPQAPPASSNGCGPGGCGPKAGTPEAVGKQSGSGGIDPSAIMNMFANNNNSQAPSPIKYASNASAQNAANPTVGQTGSEPYFTPAATASSSLKDYQKSLPTEVPADDMGCSEAADKALFLIKGKHPFDFTSKFETEKTGQVTITSDDWRKILDNDMGMKEISDSVASSKGAPASYTTPKVGDAILIDRKDGTAHIMVVGEGELIDQRQRPISQDAFAEEIGPGDRVTIWRDDRYSSTQTASLIDGSEYNPLNQKLMMN